MKKINNESRKDEMLPKIDPARPTIHCRAVFALASMSAEASCKPGAMLLRISSARSNNCDTELCPSDLSSERYRSRASCPIKTLSLVSVLIGQEARDLYLSLDKSDGQSSVSQLFDRADEILNNIAPGLQDASADIDASAKTALQWIVGRAGSIFGSISSFLLSLFIFFIALYYLLREGPRVRHALIEFSPLSDNEDKAIFERLERAVNSVIKGNLMIALIQGALAMLGFAIFGVPHAILWGAVTAVAALIPGIGTALVFAPVIGFLFFTGDIFSAVALVIWGALAVGLIDNLLGPRLIGRGMQLHPLLVLLSVLGGLIFFGASGIFLGPLSLSLFFSLLSIYRQSSKRAS